MMWSFSQVAGSTTPGSEERAWGWGRSSEKPGGCNERRAGETAPGFPADPAAVSGGPGGVWTSARNYPSHQWKSGKKLYWKHSLRKRGKETGWEKRDRKWGGEGMGSLPPKLSAGSFSIFYWCIWECCYLALSCCSVARTLVTSLVLFFFLSLPTLWLCLPNDIAEVAGDPILFNYVQRQHNPFFLFAFIWDVGGSCHSEELSWLIINFPFLTSSIYVQSECGVNIGPS